VADLAEGVLKAMYPSKLRLVTLAVLGMALSLTSGGLFHSRSSDPTQLRANAAPDAAKPAAKEKAPPAQPSRPGVVQGENYLVFPITTPLQRHLLGAFAGAWATRHPHAYLVVDGGSAVGPDGSVNAKALDFNALGKALKRFENAPSQQGPDIIVNVTVPGNASEQGAQLLGWALKGFAAERSFPHVRLTFTWSNEKYSWKDRIERLNKRSADSKEARETPSESPLCSVYPVQTMLSRWLTEDADCVVDIANPLEPDRNGALASDVEKAIRTQLGRLQLPRKDKLFFALPGGDQQGSQEAARKFVALSALSLAQSLGFKTSSVTIR
jgi:hypothetical protein